MFTSLFWKDTAERLVKTFAQALLAIFLVAPQTNVVNFDWPSALGVAATAAVISLLTSVVSAIGTKNTPTVSPASAAPNKRGV